LIAIKRFYEKIGNNYTHHSIQATIEDFIDEKDYFFEDLLQLIPDSIVYSEKNKYGKENSSHVTILYGLKKDSDFHAIRDMIKSYKPFEIEFGDISIFDDNSKYDVVKVEIISQDLHILHNLIKDKFKNVWSYDQYNPHMTIAYVKKNKYQNTIINPYLGKKILVDTISFMHKNGYAWDISLEGG
jgi:hypothetical protein